MIRKCLFASLVGAAVCSFAAGAVNAGDAAPPSGADAAYREMTAMFGFVPEFAKAVPQTAIAGAWQQEKDLDLSDKTALPAKTKALISLAVAAQIPCDYCVYIDTINAKRAGATAEEIREAVAVAGLTRFWSTTFHGNQVDFTQFKKDVDRLTMK